MFYFLLLALKLECVYLCDKIRCQLVPIAEWNCEQKKGEKNFVHEFIFQWLFLLALHFAFEQKILFMQPLHFTTNQWIRCGRQKKRNRENLISYLRWKKPLLWVTTFQQHGNAKRSKRKKLDRDAKKPKWERKKQHIKSRKRNSKWSVHQMRQKTRNNRL